MLHFAVLWAACFSTTQTTATSWKWMSRWTVSWPTRTTVRTTGNGGRTTGCPNWRRSTAPQTRTRSAGWVLMIQTGEVQHLRPGQDLQGEYSWYKLEKYSTSDQDKIRRVSTHDTNWRSAAPQTRTRSAGWVLMIQTGEFSTSDQDKIRRVSTHDTNWRSAAPQTRTRSAKWVLMEQTEGEVQHLRPGQDPQAEYSWYKLEKCSTSDQDKIRRVSTHGTNWRRSTAPKTRTRSAGWVLMIQTGEVQHLGPGQDPQSEYSWNKLKEKYST